MFYGQFCLGLYAQSLGFNAERGVSIGYFFSIYLISSPIWREALIIFWTCSYVIYVLEEISFQLWRMSSHCDYVAREFYPLGKHKNGREKQLPLLFDSLLHQQYLGLLIPFDNVWRLIPFDNVWRSYQWCPISLKAVPKGILVFSTYCNCY